MRFDHRFDPNKSLEQQVSGFFYGFLIPIFFINMGISFELIALLEPRVLLLTRELIAAAVAVKPLSAVLFSRQLSLRETLASEVLLSARLSLAIAVAMLGVRIDLMEHGLRSSVILMALITSTFASTLFRFLAPPLPQNSNRDPTDTSIILSDA